MYIKVIFKSVLILWALFPDNGNGKPITGYLLPFQDCGSKYELISITISSCLYAPCRIPIGNVVSVTAEFGVSGGVKPKALTHAANWLLNNVYTKAIVTPEECTEQCPVSGNEGLSFTAELTVSNTLPSLRGSLLWRVNNNLQETVLCYEIPISLTS